MKKILLSLSAFALLALPSVKAQYINPDFETWTHNAGPPAYDDPNTGLTNNGWQEFNFTSQTVLGSSPISVFKDSAGETVAPYHGTYCAKITTVPLSPATISLIGHYLPYDTLGLVFTGSVDEIHDKVYAKIPFTLGVLNYYFYYQYAPVGTDTAFCLVNYSRHDTLIASGEIQIKAAQSTWTQAEVTPVVLKPGLPDSISIFYSSSSWHRPKVGSTFYVDDATNTGIPSMFGNTDNVMVYPNPANNEINIKVSGQAMASTVQVYDITGRAIGTYSIRNNFLTINTQSYTGGLYIYKLLDDSGNELNVGKFSVAK